ncbi:OLC1v1023681C1 [Oldenlandia corymbosa var. corymbosa]|uniref:Xyloglucan endotransglucosylase/hydrolase n=1 Tax=Oldenlandia corymbosa var. corymbosa TaxID=529605 RepID=A0AAV1C0Q9_OLDCO|nr:OLC1v1023681C1 [Oldenlandia corymbosa var. corymbosa]
MKKSSFITAFLVFMASVLASHGAVGNFYRDVSKTFGDQRVQISEGGRQLSLSLDQQSGSGFQSNSEYWFGRFDMKMKLAPGNSAGTVTTFYLSSQGPGHSEIDFEFLGNASGQPYTCHTNVFALGKGGKEQQFHLWFDPTAAFHTYSIVWNPQRIIFLVDNIQIRVFNNHEAHGVAFPKDKPMKVYCSFWEASDWATQGGRLKIDWANAPFKVYYRDFNANACIHNKSSACHRIGTDSISESMISGQEWRTQGLDGKGRNRIRWVQNKFMVYNYCSDLARFPQGVPSECKRPRF